MEWSKEDVRMAFNLFINLLREGRIGEDNSELRYAYQRPEVRQIIEEVIEEEAGVKIFDLQGIIYLTPGVSNSYFGYKNAELRDRMKLKTNDELYLAYFSILCLLSKFYSSEDQSMASRQFLSLEELERTITGYLEEIAQGEEEEVESLEEEFQINLKSIADIWEELPPFDDQLKSLRRGRNNRISFLLRVMAFLEEEELVQVLEDDIIRLQPRLEHTIIRYYFHSERKEALLGLLSEESLLQREADQSELESEDTNAPH